MKQPALPTVTQFGSCCAIAIDAEVQVACALMIVWTQASKVETGTAQSGKLLRQPASLGGALISAIEQLGVLP